MWFHRAAQIAGVVCLAVLSANRASAEGLVDALVRRFAESDFEFSRVRSNAPFMPIAWINATGYQEATLRRRHDDGLVNAEQRSFSQGAFVPLPLSKRDALVVGEWIGWTQFDLQNAATDEIDVLSVGVPVGWARQQTPDWQLGAFVAPLGHRTARDDWYWETMGGFFARYSASERTAWVFGAYFDMAPLEDVYLPYIGATFILNERWSINAIMPWPSVTFAPTADMLFRLGIAPSGTSWSVEPGERRPRMNFGAWNFGLSVERRLYKYLWIAAEIGVSGIRGLSLVGGDWQGLETKLDSTGFALLTVNFRPAAL